MLTSLRGLFLHLPRRTLTMCTRYISPEAGDIERAWHGGSRNPRKAGEVLPNYPAPFIRAARDRVERERELVVGLWSLIPWFAKERKLKYPTANARSEELQQRASCKNPWNRGQRCIVPAQAFYEPCWETGKHVPGVFRRPGGEPWGLAGLWSVWHDKGTGEDVESYTLLTINADRQPLMSRMHRPDPSRPSHMQDKRSVVPIELEDTDQWLFGTVEDAQALIQVPAADAFVAEPGPVAVRASAKERREEG